jgi:hypothetical protein
MKTSILALIILCIVGFLIFFFVTLFDFIFPPKGGKDTVAKSREKIAVDLYFSDVNERFLQPEKRFIPKEKTVDGQAKEIVKALIDGSKANLVNTFPSDTLIQSVKVNQSKMAIISFSKNLQLSHPGGSASEMATVYSLTNSLTINIPAVERVKILIDEKDVASLKGHIGIRSSFTMNKEIIAPGS